MIQILGLRKFVPKDSKDGKEKTYDAFHEKYWRAESVPDLFANLDRYLQKIPERDRWNLFYTLANCAEAKRDFKSLGVIAFDIDGFEEKYQDSYIEVILAALKVPKDKVGIVASGHGLHFIIQPQKPISDKASFKGLKPHYKAVCLKINKALFDAGLSGRADPSIFEPRRILRLPKTVNRKPDKPEAWCTLLQSNIEPINFDFTKLSDLPKVAQKEQLNTKVLAKFPRVDSGAIMDGCEFLKHCKKSPNGITEGEWYAALSITGRMNDESDKDGYEWSHELSRGYKGYDPDETDSKIEQALEASGPRTCDNINQLWDGCSGCEFRNKVSSPILIRSKNAIATEFTGFHNQPFSGKGKPSPNYDDLVKYFNREYSFRGLDSTGMTYTWRGSHYEYFGTLLTESFAQQHFNPSCNNNMAREFAGRVRRTNIKPTDWWVDSPKRKINFKNGYLDIRSMDFKPHDKELGFRYVLPFEYSPTATAPTFEKMLDMVMEGDKTRIDVLLEYMGYCLSNDDCWTQKALFMVGEGANGKSTILKVLRDLAGDGNSTSYTIKQLNDSEYNRQGLDGKLFNISEETPTKAMLDNSLFKSLVTGDEIQARCIYKDPYFIRNSAKFVFTANELPVSYDTTYGYWRRLIVLPFNATFTRETPGYDPHIGDKLTKELPGIFNMVMEGYHRLIENQKFTDSEEIDRALGDYQFETDSVLRWFKETMVVHTNGGFETNFRPVQELYESYKYQTEAEGVNAVTKQKFCRALARMVPGYEERNTVKWINNKPVRGLQGVSVHAFG